MFPRIKKIKKTGLFFLLSYLLLYFVVPVNLLVYAQEASPSGVVVTPEISPTISVSPTETELLEAMVTPTISPTNIPTEVTSSVFEPIPTEAEPTPTMKIETTLPELTTTPTLMPTLVPTLILEDSLPSGASARNKLPVKIKLLSKTNLQANESLTLELANSEGNPIQTSLKKGKETIDVTIKQKLIWGSTVLVVDPPVGLKPGKYTLQITDSLGTVEEQDFLWGVLAINFNKSVYLPNDEAGISMSVLDEEGRMVCDALLHLEIKTPEGQAIILSTENGKIIVNPECQIKGYVEKPDYEAHYQVGKVGQYEVSLNAQTKNGSYAVNDAFMVKETVAFDIERVTATRIYPPERYPVVLKITTNEDFNGIIEETVPNSFEVFELEQSLPYEEVKTVPYSSPISLVTNNNEAIDLAPPFNGAYEITLGFGGQLNDFGLKEIYDRYGLLGHDGLDFNLPIGTPIFAADGGAVVLEEEKGDYGQTVVLQHSWGKSYYGHLSEIKVAKGQKVSKGEEIGLSGNSGLTTGAHLHFGIKLNQNNPQNGYYGKIDPLPYLSFPTVIAEESVKSITWRVNLKKGEKITLGYQYKAPSVSPQFYLLGPLVFKTKTVVSSPAKEESSFVFGVATGSADIEDPTKTTSEAKLNSDSPGMTNYVTKTIFQETRKWQIAVDAVTFAKTNTAYAQGSSLSDPYNFTVNKPTGTVDGDIMFMFLSIYIATPPTIDSVPSGWTEVATNTAGNSRWYLYYRVASSEGSSYTWSLSASCRYLATNITYASGAFDVQSIDDIIAISNTLYGTAGTTVRAASMNVSTTYSPLIFFGAIYNTTARSFTPPTTPTSAWVEDYEYGNGTPDMSQTIDSLLWTGSGDTGDMDAACSTSITTNKHAFAIALKFKNIAPEIPTLAETPTFAYLDTNDTTPVLGNFSTTDREEDSVEYEIQWDDDYNFGSATTKTSSNYPTDAGWTAATFTSGTSTAYTVQAGDALTNGVTYWWRVRARDPSGGNSWSSYSTLRSFTINTSLGLNQWFQTTDEQFDTDTLTNVNTTSNSVTIPGSFTKRGTAFAQASAILSPYDFTVNKPTGTVDGDIMFMFLQTYLAGTPPTIDSVPSGWTQIATNNTTYNRWYLYYRVASSEGSSYTWSLSASCRYLATNITYASGAFDVQSIDDIIAISNTLYGTAGTTVRAASMNVSTTYSPLIFFGAIQNNTVRTFDKPSAPNTDWVEDYDYGHTTPDISQTIDSMIWSGSGDTGDMDATCSTSITTYKHAFAIALKPAASGTIVSTEVDYDWLSGATSWGTAVFATTETTGDVKLRVYYTASTACDTIVPDDVLTGNSSGFDVTASPISLSGLTPVASTYNKICLKATLTYSSGIPYLNDWAITWASAVAGPNLNELMRHGKWFNSSGARQPFTF